MQESNLTGPFEHFPSEVNIAHALAYFDQREPVIKVYDVFILFKLAENLLLIGSGLAERLRLRVRWK